MSIPSSLQAPHIDLLIEVRGRHPRSDRRLGGGTPAREWNPVDGSAVSVASHASNNSKGVAAASGDVTLWYVRPFCRLKPPSPSPLRARAS